MTCSPPIQRMSIFQPVRRAANRTFCPPDRSRATVGLPDLHDRAILLLEKFSEITWRPSTLLRRNLPASRTIRRLDFFTAELGGDDCDANAALADERPDWVNVFIYRMTAILARFPVRGRCP